MTSYRDSLHAALGALFRGEIGVEAVFAPDAVVDVSHPAGRLTGWDQIEAGLLAPLRTALPGFRMRDLIVIGGENQNGPGRWVATLGHVAGNFTAPLWGIPPHRKLAQLRVGAFYRVDAGHVVEAKILLDLLDLLLQIGRFPLPHELGAETIFPPPETLDGVCPRAPERSAASHELVARMLRDLHIYDPNTFSSTGQTGPNGYWHPQMFWYGPAGIGANHTYPMFDRDHRVAFLTAFPDRKGGNHFARFGDSDYVASGGWPSMTMTHAGPYLGLAPTGRKLTLRVMDFWRVSGGKIMENWVLLDLVELWHQLGVDLIREATAAPA